MIKLVLDNTWAETTGEKEPYRDREALILHDAAGNVVRVFARVKEPLPLPSEPGYYLPAAPRHGEIVVVELLNRPRGQWVDAGDRTYLDEDTIRGLGPLDRLERRSDTADAVLNRIAAEPWAREVDLARWRAEFAREFGVSS